MKILIIDDHYLISHSLKTSIQSDQYEVDCCSNGADALKKIDKTKYNLIITDLSLQEGGVQGIDILKYVKENYKETTVICMTGFTTNLNLLLAEQSGADGFFLKKDPIDEIIKIVNEILKNNATLPILSSGAKDYFQKHNNKKLTPRETEVLAEIDKGLNAKEIAKKMKISINTLNTHKKNLFEKANVNRETQLLSVAREKGWLG